MKLPVLIALLSVISLMAAMIVIKRKLKRKLTAEDWMEMLSYHIIGGMILWAIIKSLTYIFGFVSKLFS